MTAIQEHFDGLKARLAPPRRVARRGRVYTRFSTNPAMNCNGGDYDEWETEEYWSAPTGMEMPGFGAFVPLGTKSGRDFYRFFRAGTSAEFDMCPACGGYYRTGGEWGFCDSCDPRR